jgi:predicted DNA-binding transcriptional regulator AlpA
MGTAQSEIESSPLKGTEVMARLGFRNRPAFWAFVWRQGVPCIRLGPRNIIFDRQQLDDWLARRSTGKASP